MNKSIVLKNKKVNYKVRQSKRAKRLRLTVCCDGSVIVTQPANVDFNNIESFIRIKADWLLEKLSFFNNLEQKLPKGNYEDYLKNKQKTLNLVIDGIEKFNKVYNFKFNKINIRNQKTRWGSCSKKRNLNFNYRIIYLPNRAIDYIIVHELCHLKEFNHSRKFWNLVERTIPNYLDIRKELKNKGLGG